MMIRLILLLAFTALPCFAAGPYYPTPSHSQIKEWWKPENREEPDEELQIGRVFRVLLKSGERAYVANVSFPARGRCCNYGILLIRPALQEARQTHSLAGVDKVIYLHQARISGIATSGSFMGQGQLSGRNEFLYFDEWEPVVLYKKQFGNDIGACGRTDYGRPCGSEEVQWLFTDLDGDWTEDLVELIITREGEEPDDLTWKTKVNVYLIKGTQLVPVSPDLIQSEPAESEGQSTKVPEEPQSGPRGVYTTPMTGEPDDSDKKKQ
jgi:hypothetical protein